MIGIPSKPTRSLFFLTACLLLSISLPCTRTAMAGETCSAEVYFSPGGNTTKAVVDLLWEAKKRVYVQAHVFSSKTVANALATLKRRGVDVILVLDREMTFSPYSQTGFLLSVGIPMSLNGRHASSHARNIVVDGESTAIGSFDLSDTSENSTSENLVTIRKNTSFTRSFIVNIEEYLSHAELFNVET